MSSIIINKLFKEPKVYSGFQNKYQKYLDRKKYINTKNIVPTIAIMVVLRILNSPFWLVFISGVIFYIYYSYYNSKILDDKIKFLNNIIFDNNEQPFEVESYLEMDPTLINFYYDNKWYIDYNLTAYRKSLESVNNLLRLEYNLEDNLMKYPEQLYENAYIEYKEALNNLHSSIYKMISHQVNNDIFNDNLEILKNILRKHIENIQKSVIKCGYNLYNINIWSIINPTNIECKNDIKTKEYSPHYSFF